MEGAYLSSVDLCKDEAHILEVSLGSDHTEGAAVESSDKQCACDTFQATDGSMGMSPYAIAIESSAQHPLYRMSSKQYECPMDDTATVSTCDVKKGVLQPYLDDWKGRYLSSPQT